MFRFYENGAYVINDRQILEDGPDAASALRQMTGVDTDRSEARKGTLSYGILSAHDRGSEPGRRSIRFDKLISHDITYVGIIQTARASGLKEFPVPYVLTNCHNSLCAVGGTINEDDHVFGLSAARKYGGVYVPAMQAVIHQYAREMLASCGDMILGSDSHTRYGALGTMAVGEGGPELVKQLLSRTYDIPDPEVVGVYLTGEPDRGVGPQDVAIALIGAVFENGFVKNRILEFIGPGIDKLSADFRIGIDVMTTETTCLSSIWETDDVIRRFYENHGRPSDFRRMHPEPIAYYDRLITLDLSKVRPMIAMPYHPSCAIEIEEVLRDPIRALRDTEARAREAFGADVSVDLTQKVQGGVLRVDQGIIAGCAGGTFENILAASDILRDKSIGNGAFSLSVYPASTPVYRALLENGAVTALTLAGGIVKPAFCGPCFGAGDTPANGALSIRHSTRNFPNREGSKVQNGQIASVALMDARSIAATAANGGILTSAAEWKGHPSRPIYVYDPSIYEKRVYDGTGRPDPEEPLVFGPNIRDWPKMPSLPENLILRIVSEIHDAVTTTDELIPSGETSSLRSNPEALSEFALSRKDPAYVGRAKRVRSIEREREAASGATHDEILWEMEKQERAEVADAAEWQEFSNAFAAIRDAFPDASLANTGIGSAIYAVKPGDGSAREQAASCQRVLGGSANIAQDYATKRYRSNLINWGMLPLLTHTDTIPFARGDYLFLPSIRDKILTDEDLSREETSIPAYVVRGDTLLPVPLTLGALSEEERRIIAAGCLINYYSEGNASAEMP